MWHWSTAFNEAGTKAILDAARRGTGKLLSPEEARAALAYAFDLLNDEDRWEALQQILASRADLLIAGEPPKVGAMLLAEPAERLVPQ